MKNTHRLIGQSKINVASQQRERRNLLSDPTFYFYRKILELKKWEMPPVNLH